MKCQVPVGMKSHESNTTSNTSLSSCYNLINREFLRNAIMHCMEMDWPNVSSCTSAVIDAKIEQAMNTVKNHLTYILQEEVDSLKEHIVVLRDRIKQLEMENDFLKSNPSPDDLRALTHNQLTATCIATSADFDKDLMQSEDMEVAAITANGNFCNRF